MRSRSGKTPVQGSLFEEDYLLRTLGPVVQSPDIALTELVANSWDAGAVQVELTIPEESGEVLTIRDDGCGMTLKQFKQRWMTLGYDRTRHQGTMAEFPRERAESRRPAFGRNGVGRHGLLCFASEYEVEMRRDGRGAAVRVTTKNTRDPFVLLEVREFVAEGHGTTLRAIVERNLPSADRILQVLAAKFLADPSFQVTVNGTSVPLSRLPGLINQTKLQIQSGITADAFFVDSTHTSRNTMQHGIAFWVGGRLVGQASWILGNKSLLDGRTRSAKRHTVVVRSDDLFDEVLPDWSGFRKSEIVERLYSAVTDYVEEIAIGLSADQIKEVTESVIREHRDQLETLRPLGRYDVAEFVQKVTAKQPSVEAESLSAGVQAIIELEKTRSGAALLEKISQLSLEDVIGLDRLLSEWTVRDALTVLDEIDKRLLVIDALAKLSADPKADELHTLHPLVTESRWLFGPEFDSPEYASNVSLATAVRRVFGKRIIETSFDNPRKRPDLLVLADATVSAVGTEQLDDASGLVQSRTILLIELKKGHSELRRENMDQAGGYVEDLLASGLIDGTPRFRAFVVGHSLDPKLQGRREIDGLHTVQATQYSVLFRTAHLRLFKLRDKLQSRYSDLTGPEAMNRLLAEPKQLGLVS